MGWDCGDQLYEELLDYELREELEQGCYLSSGEVGVRDTAEDLKVSKNVNILVCYGCPTRWNILNVISMKDDQGMLWALESAVTEF